MIFKIRREGQGGFYKSGVKHSFQIAANFGLKKKHKTQPTATFCFEPEKHRSLLELDYYQLRPQPCFQPRPLPFTLRHRVTILGEFSSGLLFGKFIAGWHKPSMLHAD